MKQKMMLLSSIVLLITSGMILFARINKTTCAEAGCVSLVRGFKVALRLNPDGGSGNWCGGAEQVSETPVYIGKNGTSYSTPDIVFDDTTGNRDHRECMSLKLVDQ